MLFDMEGRLHINKHSKNADTSAFTLETTHNYYPQLLWYNPPFSKNVGTNIETNSLP